jgi:hypothetical protein
VSPCLADYLIGRGVSVTKVRKLIQGVGFIGPAIALVGLTFTNTAVGQCRLTQMKPTLNAPGSKSSILK